MDPEDRKPDFSNVVSGSSSTAPAPVPAAAAGSSPGEAGAIGERTGRIYVVEKGDSLSKIAKKFYGEANAWHRIFEANRERIKDPDMIQPGWKLHIPE